MPGKVLAQQMDVNQPKTCLPEVHMCIYSLIMENPDPVGQGLK